MPQSLSNVLIHLVFSTKNREPYLRDKGLRDNLHAYMGGVSNALKCPAIQIGGMSDHVHLLVSLSRTSTIADLVKELKRVSTDWIQQQAPTLSGFHWQAGYGVFSVSESSRGDVIGYIQNQEEHHRGRSFQEEYRGLCERHGISIDERYAWD